MINSNVQIMFASSAVGFVMVIMIAPTKVMKYHKFVVGGNEFFNRHESFYI